ncbi:hypothetical protein [Persephonella sp.]
MITHRISLIITLIFFSFAVSADIDMEKLERYVQEEVDKKDDSFKKELDRCLKEAEKLGSRPDIEIQLENAGCKGIFDQYEELIEKATERYSKEIDNLY